MKNFAVRITLIFTVLSCFVEAANAGHVECNASDEIRIIASELNTTTWIESYERMAESPDEATCALINELRVVDTAYVPGGQEIKFRDTMHVIWCVRMLRAITGLKFTATTQHPFGPRDEDREFWLKLKDDINLPFFTSLHSSDSVYIAPGDVQSGIIGRWIEWYGRYGKGHRFPKKMPPIDDWYY